MIKHFSHQIFISLLFASLAFTSATHAQQTGFPPVNSEMTRGNCDFMATNTVRATFMGVQEFTQQSLDGQAGPAIRVAVFRVEENLAYEKHIRYGDPKLKAGTLFTVEMARNMPGQPASVVDTIEQMQQGEEALLKIDHIFLLGEGEEGPLRPCSRIARRGEATAPQPENAHEEDTYYHD